MSIASRVFRIQKGEGTLVALIVGLMFISLGAATIGESAIDALFFDRIGPQALPIMFLLQGGAALMAMVAITGTLGRLGPRRAYLGAPLLLVTVVVGERALLLVGSGWI